MTQCAAGQSVVAPVDTARMPYAKACPVAANQQVQATDGHGGGTWRGDVQTLNHGPRLVDDFEHPGNAQPAAPCQQPRREFSCEHAPARRLRE